MKLRVHQYLISTNKCSLSLRYLYWSPDSCTDHPYICTDHKDICCTDHPDIRKNMLQQRATSHSPFHNVQLSTTNKIQMQFCEADQYLEKVAELKIQQYYQILNQTKRCEDLRVTQRYLDKLTLCFKWAFPTNGRIIIVPNVM